MSKRTVAGSKIVEPKLVENMPEVLICDLCGSEMVPAVVEVVDEPLYTCLNKDCLMHVGVI